MPIDPACQPFADQIKQLGLQRDPIRTSLPTLAPADRWSALAQIGGIDRQITAAQRDLDSCQRQHTTVAYEGHVTVFDTSGAPPGSRRARLWRMDGNAPTVLEEASLQGGAFSFTSQLGAAQDRIPLGITVDETNNPSIAGLDFRSGSLSELPRAAPDDPAGRIEIVLGPTVRLSADDLADWLAAIPLPQTGSIPITGMYLAGADVAASAEITLAQLNATLAAGRVHLAAAGTARVSGLPLMGSLSAPFSLDVPLSLALPQTPDTDQVCDILTRGTPQLDIGGPLGSILTAAMPLLLNHVGGQALPRLRAALNEYLPFAIAALFGLRALPAGAVPSVRRFEITPSEITLAATIGAFGDVLSTFQP